MLSHELTQFTRQHYSGALVEVDNFGSTTTEALLQDKEIVTGAAAPAERIIFDIASVRPGKWFQGLETFDYNVQKGSRTLFAEWYDHEIPMALAGTELRRQLGVLVEQVTEAANMEALGDKKYALQSMISAELMRAKKSKFQACDNAIIGPRVDVVAIESLDELFDETASFHGGAPTDLPQLSEVNAKDPWALNPLSTDDNQYIWTPTIVHNSGVAETISFDLLRNDMDQMQLRWPVSAGKWINAGIYPDLFQTLESTWDAQRQGNLRKQEDPDLRIECIYYGRVRIFRDLRAPTDRVRFIHPDYLQTVFWAPSGMETTELAMESIKTSYPMWTTPWRIANLQDGVYGDLMSMWKLRCTGRIAMVEHRDLEA